MNHRNLSPSRMFEQWAIHHKPTHAFSGATQKDFEAWKAETKPKVMATLGEFPERVPLNSELEVEFEHDGLMKQRWMIDVGPYISARVQINRPKGLGKHEKLPVIQCWHGHGPFGKEAVMGNDSSAELRADIAKHNYNYGHQMAKAGFITFGIDWIGGGQRSDTAKPHYRSTAGTRDWCNLYYLMATMIGTTSIAINLSHGMAATDFVLEQSNVDGDKLGVMGLSGGGTMTTWTALTDARIKAAEIICYCDLWETFGFRDINFCGMQAAPGLYKLVDLPDLQGLIAPKPLLIDIGAYDSCFLADSAMDSYRQVENIYKVAGAADKLYLDLSPTEHSWGGNKSVEFFGNNL